jgi:hypothetical protein
MHGRVGCRAVPDVLIFADSVTSPAMRHEVPVVVPDPFVRRA